MYTFFQYMVHLCFLVFDNKFCSFSVHVRVSVPRTTTSTTRTRSIYFYKYENYLGLVHLYIIKKYIILYILYICTTKYRYIICYYIFSCHVCTGRYYHGFEQVKHKATTCTCIPSCVWSLCVLYIHVYTYT